MILFPSTHTSCRFVAMLLADVAVLMMTHQSRSVERSTSWPRTLRKDIPTEIKKQRGNNVIMLNLMECSSSSGYLFIFFGGGGVTFCLFVSVFVVYKTK